MDKTTSSINAAESVEAESVEAEVAEQQKRVEARWAAGISHNIEAVHIVYAIAKYCPSLDLKFGGDGDNGEELLRALSLWVEDGKP